MVCVHGGFPRCCCHGCLDLRQIRRLRRFINTVLLLRKQDKPESWLIKKIKTLQKIKVDADDDQGTGGDVSSDVLKEALQATARSKQGVLLDGL